MKTTSYFIFYSDSYVRNTPLEKKYLKVTSYNNKHNISVPDVNGDLDDITICYLEIFAPYIKGIEKGASLFKCWDQGYKLQVYNIEAVYERAGTDVIEFAVIEDGELWVNPLAINPDL